MRSDFKKMLDETRDEQAANMRQFIKEAIQETAATVTQGAVPAITPVDYSAMLVEFKNEIRAMLKPGSIPNQLPPNPNFVSTSDDNDSSI